MLPPSRYALRLPVRRYQTVNRSVNVCFREAGSRRKGASHLAFSSSPDRASSSPRPASGRATLSRPPSAAPGMALCCYGRSRWVRFSSTCSMKASRAGSWPPAGRRWKDGRNICRRLGQVLFRNLSGAVDRCRDRRAHQRDRPRHRQPDRRADCAIVGRGLATACLVSCSCCSVDTAASRS